MNSSPFERPLATALARPRRHTTAGMTLIEIIVVSGVIGLLLVVGIPNIARISATARLDAAASEVAVALRRAHQHARLKGHNVGVKFFTQEGGPTTYALYTDGDSDGVRSVDIDRGIDPQLAPRQPLEHMGKDIRFGIPRDASGRPPRAPNSRRRLDRLDDPIRFNRSDMASFAAAGTATPGTVYLTDGRRAFAVRVRNRAGKVQVLRYDRQQEIWK